MTTANTNAPVLKEGTNKVTVIGVLSEKNLELKEYTNQQGEKVESIVGTISVRTGEHEVHQVRLRSNKFTKAGKENSLYKDYLTIQNETTSQADCAQSDNPDLKPDVVKVDGALVTNEYYGQDGQLRQFQQVQGKFVNRITDFTKEDMGAFFEVDTFIEKKRPEVDREGIETGRTILNTLIPSYSSIFPFEFKVIEEGKDYFEDSVEKNQTVKLYGQLLNKKIEHVKLVEAGFGDPIEEKTYDYVNEALVKTAAHPYEEDSAKAFKPELVKEALVKRDVYLEKQKAGAGNNSGVSVKQPQTGFGGNTEVKKPAVSGLTGVDVSALF